MEQNVEIKANKIPWLEILAILLSLCGAIVSAGGAMEVYASQVQTFGGPMWPLPGLFMVYWAVLGIASLAIITIIAGHWLNTSVYIPWVLTGAFIPMIILGALSIGFMVLVGFVFFLLSTILLSIRDRVKLLTSLGFLVLGVILSAVVSASLIVLGQLYFRA